MPSNNVLSPTVRTRDVRNDNRDRIDPYFDPSDTAQDLRAGQFNARRGDLPSMTVDHGIERERLDKALAPTPFLFWIEGRIGVPGDVISAGPAGERTMINEIMPNLIELGLHPWTADWDGETPPDLLAPKRRRWTFRRVRADDIIQVISRYPGIRRDDLRDRLYREDPWTSDRQKTATIKLKVFLHRLQKEPGARIARRYDETGTDRYFPAGFATLNAMSLLPRPDAILPLSFYDRPPLAATDVPTVDQLQVGLSLLRRLISANSEALDAILTESDYGADILTSVYAAMRAVTIRGDADPPATAPTFNDLCPFIEEYARNRALALVNGESSERALHQLRDVLSARGLQPK